MANEAEAGVVIIFPNVEHARRFMSWLDNQGEQDYWEYMSNQDVRYPRQLRYNYSACVIEATEVE